MSRASKSNRSPGPSNGQGQAASQAEQPNDDASGNATTPVILADPSQAAQPVVIPTDAAPAQPQPNKEFSMADQNKSDQDRHSTDTARAATDAAASSGNAFADTVKQAGQQAAANAGALNETLKAVAEDGRATAEQAMDAFNARAGAAMEKSGQMAQDMVAFSQGNVEALVEATRIATQHLETLGRETADFGRHNVEEMTRQMKAYAAVRSPAEFFQLYAENARKAFDAAVAHGSKTSELMLKMGNEAAQPLSSRAAVAMSKLKTPQA